MPNVSCIVDFVARQWERELIEFELVGVVDESNNIEVEIMMKNVVFLWCLVWQFSQNLVILEDVYCNLFTKYILTWASDFTRCIAFVNDKFILSPKLVIFRRCEYKKVARMLVCQGHESMPKLSIIDNIANSKSMSKGVDGSWSGVKVWLSWRDRWHSTK
jgi:hypothetical protein